MSEFERLWESIGSIVKTVLLLAGGFCLFMHIVHVGRFPEDVKLSEGLLLYFISSGFVVIYALYWLSVTAVGLCVFRWPMELVRFVSHRSPTNAAAYVPTDYKVMWAFPVWPLAILAILVFLPLYRIWHLDLVMYGELILLQGAFGGFVLTMRGRLRFKETGLSLVARSGSETSDATLRQGVRVLLGIWLLGPLMIGQNQGSLVEAAFTLARIRKIHATVHVASPWDTRLTEAGLAKRSSFLGEKYARFDDVTVSHMSIGSRVAIEIPYKDGKSKEVYIPRALIEVE